MGHTSLPKGGPKFSFNLDRPGNKSFRTTLGVQARHNALYKGLNKGNVDTIVDAVGTKINQRKLRREGALGRYTIRKANRKLWAAYKSNPKEFTKSDFKVGKELNAGFSRENQAKQAGHHRRILDLSSPSPDEMSSPTHFGSINSMMRKNSGLGSSPSIPSSGPPKPPRMRPSF